MSKIKYIFKMFDTHFETDIGTNGMKRIYNLYLEDMNKEQEKPSKNSFIGWYLTEFGDITEVRILELCKDDADQKM